MIEIATHVATGFFVSLWIGFLLGLIEAWSKKALLGVFVVMALVVIGGVFTTGTTELAAELNWAYIVGTVPGYLLGIPAGKLMYNEAF